MRDIAGLALVMATLGQVGLCTSVLLARAPRTRAYLPLAVFFIASGVISAGPAVATFLPALETHFIAATLPAYLLLGPMLWLYVEGLTSETPWRFQQRHIRHVVLFGLGLFAMALTISLSLEHRTQIFIEGVEVKTAFASGLMIYLFLLILGWVAQSGYYLIRVFHRLSTYRQRLKDLFASNDQRELQWLTSLVIVIGGVWLLSFAMVVSDNFFAHPLLSHRAGAMMSLVLVWSLGLWGLRQKPGFEGRYLDDAPSPQSSAPLETPVADAAPDNEPDASDQKYQHSALGDEQSRRIAGKIDAAMSRDELYLDPALSLHRLAAHIAVSPNYISQTLNETIGASFFDYVNQKRIEAAKPQVISGEATILAVALNVGFNARSSFYKAFKRETGQTPSEYRMTHGAQQNA